MQTSKAFKAVIEYLKEIRVGELQNIVEAEVDVACAAATYSGRICEAVETLDEIINDFNLKE